MGQRAGQSFALSDFDVSSQRLFHIAPSARAPNGGLSAWVEDTAIYAIVIQLDPDAVGY